MRGDREIVIFDNKIPDRGSRHVQAERFPGIAIVKRDVDGAFCPGEEQTFPLCIFSNHIDVFVIWNSMHDFRPRFAGIVRAVNVRTQIIEPECVYRSVSGIGIEVTGIDDRYLLPR